MNRRGFHIGIVALLLAGAAPAARAQELQLKEADIRKIIPVLRAQAAAFGAARAVFDRQEAARTSFSGDPLEFLRGRAKLEPPQGLRYVPGCSRAASVNGPVAIFTFGRDMDCYDRALLAMWKGVKRGPDEKLPSEPSVSPACRAEREQAIKFLDDNQAILEKRGYQFVSHGPGGFPIYLDSPGRIFRVYLDLYNTYDLANPPEVHPLHLRIENEQAREAASAACSNMPSGPIFVVHPGDRFFEKELPDALEVVLRKAGLSEEQLDALRTALFMARMDADPEMMRAAEAAAGGDPAALQALAVRRANADLYRRFAAELDPLLDALIPKQ